MAVPVIASSDHVAGSGGSTVVIPAPSGIANGDILMAQVGVEYDSVTVSPPSGFVSLAKAIDAGVAAEEIFWKRAASESGSYTFTVTGAGWSYGSMIRITGAVASGSPIDVVGATVGGVDSSAPGQTTIPGVTTLTADVLLLAWAGDLAGHTGTVSAGGFTEEYDNPAVSNALYLASKSQASAGASGTVTIDWSTTPSHYVGVMIGIRSTSGGGVVGRIEQVMQAMKRASYW